MTDPRYRIARTTTHVDLDPPVRIHAGENITVNAGEVMLTTYPDGGRAVTIRGRYVTVNGDLGRQDRTVGWHTGGPADLGQDAEDLPHEVSAIVDDVQPGWWSA